MYEATCRNCGHTHAEPDAKFCANCGQETKEHLPGFWEYLHELVTHYVALEGKLWRTLWYLFTRPGFLTVEYFAGRRQRYIRPLRLYFSVSIVFFLLIKVLGLGAYGINLNTEKATQPLKININLGDSWGPLDPMRVAIKARAAAKTEKYKAMTAAQAINEVGSAILNLVPYALFICMPIYAAILGLIYRRRKLSYGAHLIATLNSFSMVFLSLLLLALLHAYLLPVLAVWLLLYVSLDLKLVYQDTWWGVTWRSILLTVVSLVPIMLLAALVFLIALLL